MPSKDIVAAIDFGTTFSGFAYSSKADFSSTPSLVFVNPPWKTGRVDVQFTKTPTSILFDKEKRFHAFGFDAEKKYNNLALRRDHTSWFFFRRFKMALHRSLEKKEEKLSLNTTIMDENGKEMKAIIVFQESIRFMKDTVIALLRERGATEEVDKRIKWVLTVPAIWDDTAKNFMRKAAVEAGIENSSLVLALEPEAASLCCRHLQNTSPDGTTTILSSGTKYTILDLGGGTADIVSHELQSDGNLKELHIPTGGDWGGIQVDSSFRQILIKLTGAEVFNKFKDEHLSDFLDLMNEFESIKQTTSGDNEDDVVVKIPATLVRTFESDTEEKLEDVVAQTTLNVEYVSGRLIFLPTTFRSLFQTTTENIVMKMKTIFHLNCSQNLNTVLMVGGFSESKVVQSEIRRAFPQKRFVIPDNPSLAIVKGAVIYGHQPSFVKCRICKYTYGFNAVREATPGETVIYKRKDMYSVFDKLVELEQEIPVGHCVIRRYTKVRGDQSSMCIMMYISTEKDPRYTTDYSCSFLGDLVIDLPTTASAEVEVKTIFGETELTVLATEISTGKEMTARFKFI